MWEENADAMRPALAQHDSLTRAAVEGHRGVLVKRTGDGLHAVFLDAADAVAATLELQLALSDPKAPPVCRSPSAVAFTPAPTSQGMATSTAPRSTAPHAS